MSTQEPSRDVPASDLDACPEGWARAIGEQLEPLRKYIRPRLGPELAAKTTESEVASSVVATALGIGPSAHHDTHLRAWLRRIALNKIRSKARHFRQACRSSGREVALAPGTEPEDLGVAGPRSMAELREFREAMMIILERLPRREAKALGLRYLESASHADIAVEMGVPVGSVGQLLLRAKRRAASLLGQFR